MYFKNQWSLENIFNDNVFVIVWFAWFWFLSFWVIGAKVLKTATLIKLFRLNLLPSFSFLNSHIVGYYLIVPDIHQKLNDPLKTNQRKQMQNSDKKVASCKILTQ